MSAFRHCVARMFGPLMACFGLALVMLGAAAPAPPTTPTTTTTRPRVDDAPSIVRQASPRAACTATAPRRTLLGRSVEPERLCSDVRDPSYALAAVASEPEPEDEDDGASELPSAAFALRSGVVDPHRSSARAVDPRRRLISTGLGRGPP